jgi:transcription elongation factor Elf1
MRRPTSDKKQTTITKKEIKQRIKELKELQGCVDCGEKNHIVLDFDHIKDKKYNVSRMIHDGFTWASIKKEVLKCEVVCANCHRIRTHRRLTEKPKP